MTRRIISILLVLLLASATVQPINAEATSKTPYSKNGCLTVYKGKIVNKNKKPFVIKGVSTHGIAWYPEYVNEKAFRTLRDKYGVNTIRLAMYTSEYHGYCNGGKKNRKALEKRIDNGVKYAKKLGMYVIIDWHILSDGNPKTHQKQAVSFFKKMAKKYKKYGNVMYEICNEPNGKGGSWKNIRSYSTTVIKAIRKINKKAIIIVGTPNWSQDIECAVKNPIKGYKNIAYSYHFYAATHKGDMRSRLASALKKGVPVVVTEFGISDASGNGKVNTSQGRKWIALLDKYKTGRVCWNLSNKKESSAIIKSSCKKLSGWGSSNLTSTGKFMLKIYTGKSLASEDKTVTADNTASNTQPGSNQTTVKPIPLPTSQTVDVQGGESADNVSASIDVSEDNGWESSGKAFRQFEVTITNTGTETIYNWTAELTFAKPMTVEQCWCGTVEVYGNILKVKPAEYNQGIAAGNTVTVGMIVSG